MRVLVVGKGGREHAIADKLSKSPLLRGLWVAPGNPGMQLQGLTCVNIESPGALVDFSVSNNIDLVVVGPEAMILSDLKARLAEKAIPCFSPDATVARLEASKLFCKEVLIQAEVPTARFKLALTLEEAHAFISQHNFESPLVVKADGLASGKGVSVCKTLDSTLHAANELSHAYGFPLLLEECLIGQELSAFALCDGEDFVVLGTACDYKRITPDLFSANTGGMGAFSPCDFISEEDTQKIESYFARTLQVLKKRGQPYQGFLFAGLMKTHKDLYVLEYNVRMGDPETQALLPRLESDLLEVILMATKHQLKDVRLKHTSQSAVHVVVASQGYPDIRMSLGHKITTPTTSSQAQLYFAGVASDGKNLINSGGRVLGVTSLGETRQQAREKAYSVVQQVQFQGHYYRQDIGE
ncbi:phosphoribosylamine--glycine ligase [Bdellovibrio sp. HCB2-146]|uniref:phosphoribosylamine--glycine ligase n=1 Tax=Bdellovibrio sp. HCB2-146 TaxID=3394362 RepID=UPI0039BD5956